jgi:hypothetical protein
MHHIDGLSNGVFRLFFRPGQPGNGVEGKHLKAQINIHRGPILK